MKRIHIVGRKNNGKTKLVMDLVGEMVRRGLRVGTIKHSPHNHELDVPGKDSFRQREAGANPAAIVTQQLIGLFAPRDPDGDVYERLGAMFADCDLVLVEGDIEADGMKIEVWRETVGT